MKIRFRRSELPREIKGFTLPRIEERKLKFKIRKAKKKEKGRNYLNDYLNYYKLMKENRS